jgi:uncharacterized protein
MDNNTDTPTPTPTPTPSQDALAQTPSQAPAQAPAAAQAAAPAQAQIPDGTTQELTTTNQEAKNMAVMVWVGTIFLSFIPGLVVYLTQKDNAYVQEQAKEALNWSITVIFGYLASTILAFILIGIFGYFILVLLNLVFGIMGAVAVSSGKAFKVPFALRLIK